jgi:hypothetical protein
MKPSWRYTYAEECADHAQQHVVAWLLSLEALYWAGRVVLALDKGTIASVLIRQGTSPARAQ